MICPLQIDGDLHNKCPVSKFIRLTTALAHFIRVALTNLILRLFAAIGAVVVTILGRRALSLANGHLIDQDYFRQFRSDL